MDIISHHRCVASRQRSDGGCLAAPIREGRFGCFLQLEKWRWLTPKPWEQVINKPYIRFEPADETLHRIQGWLQLWLPRVTVQRKGWSWTAAQTQAAVRLILVQISKCRSWFRSWISPHQERCCENITAEFRLPIFVMIDKEQSHL